MPEISLFYGIWVTMYYDNHNPPHFHAEYNGNKAIIEIDTARCIKGALPSRQLKLILAWCVCYIKMSWCRIGNYQKMESR